MAATPPSSLSNAPTTPLQSPHTLSDPNNQTSISPASPPSPAPPATAPPPSTPPVTPSPTSPSPPPPTPSPPSPPALPPLSSPPPPVLALPPPSEGSPAPKASSPPPPVLTPSPTGSVPPSPLPPSNVTPPASVPPKTSPSKLSPPPPNVTPPPSVPPKTSPSKLSPPPSNVTPPASETPKTSPSPSKLSPPPHPSPPGSQSTPPSVNSPLSPPLATPSPSVPSSSSPPTTTPTPSTSNSSAKTPTSSPSISTVNQTPATKTNGSENSTSPDTGNLKTGAMVAIGMVVGLVLLSLVFAVWFVQKQRKRRAGINDGYIMPSQFASSQNSDSVFLRPCSPAPLLGSRSASDFIYAAPEAGGVTHARPRFTFEELVQATDGFSIEHLLGEGGFGSVYKGVLSDGRDVAVKQLKIGGGQGEREFQAEVEFISRVHHRHLVSMVGYCISEHQRLIVYDYVPNNTLYYHLHGEGRPVMDWATRLKVAVGSARGIAYLHEDCHPRIIHRDFKSSNILLNNNFEAQVSDFGLAKLALDSNTHVTTRVMGTFGYMAPEYATSGKLTEKSDVYSFGVVLLELITGRKPVDALQPLGDESLVEWARPLLSRALETESYEELVDPRLEKNYDKIEMIRMIEAAAACVRHSAIKRPCMSQVVRALDSSDEFSDLINGMKPGQSEVIDSGENSALIRMFRRMAFGTQDYSSEYFNRTHSSWNSTKQAN